MRSRLKKPEPIDVQGICIICGTNKQSSRGYGKYRPTCQSCHNERFRGRRHNDLYRRPYIIYKKDFCELCDFTPVHMCQLDVDHIDGNHDNNDPSNLQTLCANCHRLKTLMNEDYKKGP